MMLKKILSTVFKLNRKKEILLSERLFLELETIFWIFKVQIFGRFDLSPNFVLIGDGAYSGEIYVESNRPLFNLSDYLAHYTKRFETTTNTEFITNEMNDIAILAKEILSFYDLHLSRDSDLYKNYEKNYPRDESLEDEYCAKHTMYIHIEDYYPSILIFDEDPIITKNLYQNYELAEFCEKILKFAIRFNSSKKKSFQPESKNTQEELVNSENPFPEVFVNPFSYSLFNRLAESYKESSTLLADFSFIYRKMFKDGLLQDYQKPEVFRKWLREEPYEIIIDTKFKTLERCITDDKIREYNSAKELC